MAAFKSNLLQLIGGFLALIVICSSSVQAQERRLSAFVSVSQVYSIGDIHGDLGALKLALAAVGLISRQEGVWIGGTSQLVLTGDLINRGPQSRAVMDFVMELESQAKESGGYVHTLLGNHEQMNTEGIVDYAHPEDFNSFEEFRNFPHQSGKTGFRNAFLGDAKYARWIRSRNSMVKINKTLFVHAGVDLWALHYQPEQVNLMISDWMRYFQGVGHRPAPETRWVIQDRGPLWTEGLAVDQRGQSQLPRAVLEEVLKYQKVSRLVVGHSVVDSVQISLNHPTYGDKVIMTDTGISSAYGKVISIFQYENLGVTAYEVDRVNGAIVKTLRSHKARVLMCGHVFMSILKI